MNYHYRYELRAEPDDLDFNNASLDGQITPRYSLDRD